MQRGFRSLVCRGRVATRRGVAHASEASRRMRGPITYGSLALVGASACGLAMYYNNEKEKRQTMATTKQTTIGKPALGGKWTLVDARSGAPVTDASYRGKFVLLYFGFSRCPDICPAELVKMCEVIWRLDDRDEIAGQKKPTIAPIFVSLDPKRDSLQQLQHFGRDFDPRVHFLVGTPQQVKIASKAFRVYSSLADADQESDDYLIDHSIVLYLLGPDGQFLDFFTQSTSSRDILKGILKHHQDILSEQSPALTAV